jgi:hypothetical protein
MINWEGCERKRSWPNLRCYPGTLLERLSENHKKISQDSRSPARDLNLGSPEYVVGVLANQPRRSVSHVHMYVFVFMRVHKLSLR